MAGRPAVGAATRSGDLRRARSGDLRRARAQRGDQPKCRRGLTLLEVLLATVILAGALATLGEVVRLATRSAAETRDLVRAQLLAASTMAKIVTGQIAPEPVPEGIFPDDPNPNNPSWTYAIAVGTTRDPGLLAIQVTVTQVVLAGQPVEYSLTRWLPDPNYAAADLSGEAEASQSESSSAEP